MVCSECGEHLTILYNGLIRCSNCGEIAKNQDVCVYGVDVYDEIKKIDGDVVIPLDYRIIDNTAYVLYSDKIERVIPAIRTFFEIFPYADKLELDKCSNKNYTSPRSVISIDREGNVVTIDEEVDVDRYIFMAFIRNMELNFKSNKNI